MIFSIETTDKYHETYKARGILFDWSFELRTDYNVLFVVYIIVFILALAEHFGKRMTTIEGTNLGTNLNFAC